MNKDVFNAIGGNANEYFSWSQIYEIANSKPELILFSEKKLSLESISRYYLDLEEFDPTKIDSDVKVNKITLHHQTSIFETFINRPTLIREQVNEFNGKNYTIKHGLMLYEDKIVLPKVLYSIVLLREHWLNAHIGARRTLEIIMNYFFVPHAKILRELAVKLAKACLGCLLNNCQPSVYKTGYFHSNKRNEIIMIDFVENLPGKQFAFTIVDLYSNFLTVYPSDSKTVKTVIEHLINYLSVHGPISNIISDNYSGFRSHLFIKFAKTHSITIKESAPYISTGRSIVERIQRTYQSALRIFGTNSTTPWTDLLPLTVFLLNNRPFKKFPDVTPFGLHFKTLRNLDYLFRKEQVELFKTHYTTENVNKITELIKQIDSMEDTFILQRQMERKNRMKKLNLAYNEHKFKINDIIVLRRRYNVIGTVRKLRSIYTAIPYVITKTTPYLIFCKSLFDATETVRSPRDIKKVSAITQDEVNMAQFDSKILALFSVISDSDIDSVFMTESIFVKETGTDLSSGVVTRSAGKRLQHREKEISIDEIMENFVDIDLDDDFLYDRKVRFLPPLQLQE